MNSNVLKAMPVLLIILGVILSCNKENDDDCSVTVSNLSATYRLTAMKYKQTSNSAEQDYLLLLPACEKDDQIKLNANMSYDYVDAGIICSPPGNDQGTWALNGNTITSNGLLNGTIESFDCTTLILLMTDVNIPGDKLTMTLRKQ